MVQKPEMTDVTDSWRGRRAALVVAHPGHELRVHGWLEIARPLVFVFTDGSGGANEGRIGSTKQLLDRVGASHGELFGRFTDKELYLLMVEGKHDVFTSLARSLAQEMERATIDYVVGDAEEGYNPGHDACRMVISAAVNLLRKKTGRALPNYDFLLAGRPDEVPADTPGRAIHLVLDDAALERKLAAAIAYPELASELDMALAKAGKEAFRHEVLRSCAVDAGLKSAQGNAKPFYETYGEQQVARGRYTTVLRRNEHLQPLAEALRKHAETT